MIITCWKCFFNITHDQVALAEMALSEAQINPLNSRSPDRIRVNAIQILRSCDFPLSQAVAAIDHVTKHR